MPKWVSVTTDTQMVIHNLVIQLYLIVQHAVPLDPPVSLHHLQNCIGFFLAITFKIAKLAPLVIPICDYALHGVLLYASSIMRPKTLQAGS